MLPTEPRSIYEKFRPILGNEDANVLMSQFPAVEADVLVIRDASSALLAGIGLLS